MPGLAMVAFVAVAIYILAARVSGISRNLAVS